MRLLSAAGAHGKLPPRLWRGAVGAIILALVLGSSRRPCHGWSASTPPPTATTINPSTTALVRPIRHVAVIGAGIAGLSVAHALLHNNNNNHVTVDLYDARPSMNSASGGGAGVQLNGGLVALGRIHPPLREAVYRAGLPQIAVESWSHSSSSTTSTTTTSSTSSSTGRKERLLQLDLPRIVRDKPSSAGCRILLENQDNNSNNNNVNEQQSQQQPPGRRLWWISIMRGALQQTLLDQLVLFQRPSGTSSTDRPRLRVQWGKKLVRLYTNDDEQQQPQQQYTCQFADGTQSDQPYDLVVDASGINSVTRRYIQNPQRLRNFNEIDDKDMDNRKTAIYSGIRIRYAVVDGKPGDDTTLSSFSSSSSSSSSSSNSGVTLRQHFGRAAYALSGIYGAGEGQPPARCAFIVYLDPNAWGPFGKRQQPPPPEPQPSSQSSYTKKQVDDDENVDWSQDNRASSLERARRDMLDQLEASGISVNSTELGQYIAQADRFFELGSYFHNPFHKWSSNEGRLVLCGDAAHALPPFLGQGANQAIQDAYCLVQQLYAYNAAVEEYNKNINDSFSSGETATTTSTDTGNEQPPPPPPQLHSYLKAYEQTRWPSTFAVFWKSVFLGYLETGGFDGVYAKFRDGFFKAMGWIGVAERVLLDAATPKLGDE